MIDDLQTVDGSQDAFVFAVRFMVLHDKHQNVADVDLHLPDKFNFERNIVVDVFFVSIRFRAVRLIKVEIDALVILKIPLREEFVPANWSNALKIFLSRRILP